MYRLVYVPGERSVDVTGPRMRACWRVASVIADPRSWQHRPRWFDSAHAYRSRIRAAAALVNYHCEPCGLLAPHREALRRALNQDAGGAR